MAKIICPYCGKEQGADHDDGHNYEEDELHQMECCKCEKYFTFYTYVSFSYDAYKADCLNGGEHKFQPTHTYPKVCTRMRCPDCGEERNPTIDEWHTILTDAEIIEAKKEYPDWVRGL